jgi:hypothetical protein
MAVFISYNKCAFIYLFIYLFIVISDAVSNSGDTASNGRLIIE